MPDWQQPCDQYANQHWQQVTTEVLTADAFRMACLRAVADLQLPDCYLAAGFVRNAIWDAAHQQAMTPLNDIDVVYFDAADLSTQREQQVAQQLARQFPGHQFEVRNQARMHLKHGHCAYQSSADAIRRWVELPTCVGVQLNPRQQLVFCAPFGLALNWSLLVEMNLDFAQPAVFTQRVQSKNWQQLWPKLQIRWPKL